MLLFPSTFVCYWRKTRMEPMHNSDNMARENGLARVDMKANAALLASVRTANALTHVRITRVKRPLFSFFFFSLVCTLRGSRMR